MSSSYSLIRQFIQTVPNTANNSMLTNQDYYFSSDGLPDAAANYSELGASGKLIFSFSVPGFGIMPHEIILTIDGSWGALAIAGATTIQASIRNTLIPVF